MAPSLGGAGRLEQGYALHFQMPAQGGHQYGIHRTATADRDFRLFFPVDRINRPLGEASGDRGVEQRGATAGIVTLEQDQLRSLQYVGWCVMAG